MLATNTQPPTNGTFVVNQEDVERQTGNEGDDRSNGRFLLLSTDSNSCLSMQEIESETEGK